MALQNLYTAANTDLVVIYPKISMVGSKVHIDGGHGSKIVMEFDDLAWALYLMRDEQRRMAPSQRRLNTVKLPPLKQPWHARVFNKLFRRSK